LGWEERKRAALERLRVHLAQGRVDPDILSLLDAINSLPFAYTTSSCSGRIQLYEARAPGEKFDMVSLGKWHSPVEPDEILSRMRGNNLWLALLPPIIHAFTCSLEASTFLLKIMRGAGFKRACIMNLSRPFIEARGTERLEIPLRLEGRDIVYPEGIRLIVGTANRMLRRAKLRISKLEVMLRDEASRGLDNLCR
jgi:tRNA wybutosine-synthesizing protein 3